jgi:hypothetical protein
MIFVLGIISLFLLFILFVWVSSIHEVIDDGEAYGFKIGMNKEAVIAKLSENTERSIEAINLVSIDNKSSKPGVLTSNFDHFYESNKWVVMYESAYFFDDVTLEFCAGSLCKIYRKRHYLEYP